MNIFKWFKKKPAVPRGSLAVRRLAERRGVKTSELDLKSDEVLEELLNLGLMLSLDGTFYYDDPHYKPQPHPSFYQQHLEDISSAFAAGANLNDTLDTPRSHDVSKPVDLPSESSNSGWSDISLGGGFFDSHDSGGGYDSGGSDGGGCDGGGGCD